MAIDENQTRKLNELDEALDIQDDDYLYLVRYPYTVLTSFKLPYATLRASLLTEIGAGNVIGPTSSVNGNLASYDGGSGLLIQDSGWSAIGLRNRTNHTGTQDWSTITGTPTTIAGYGIIDASSAITVKEEGVTLTGAANTFNFVGPGVTATASGPVVTVTVLGGGDMVLSGVQTVTGNKTFSAGTLKVNNAANTFLHTFASLATADRVITLPDVTGTISTIAGAESLSNKTLVAPIINVGTDSAGDIYYRDAGGLFARLPIGAPYQTMTVSLAGIPAWVNAGYRLLGSISTVNLNATAPADIGVVVVSATSYIPL